MTVFVNVILYILVTSLPMIADVLLEFLGLLIWDIIVVPIWNRIILPIMWILATPFIIIMSLFGEDTYFQNMKKYYVRIKNYFWKDYR